MHTVTASPEPVDVVPVDVVPVDVVPVVAVGTIGGAPPPPPPPQMGITVVVTLSEWWPLESTASTPITAGIP